MFGHSVVNAAASRRFGRKTSSITGKHAFAHNQATDSLMPRASVPQSHGAWYPQLICVYEFHLHRHHASGSSDDRYPPRLTASFLGGDQIRRHRFRCLSEGVRAHLVHRKCVVPEERLRHGLNVGRGSCSRKLRPRRSRRTRLDEAECFAEQSLSDTPGALSVQREGFLRGPPASTTTSARRKACNGSRRCPDGSNWSRASCGADQDNVEIAG